MKQCQKCKVQKDSSAFSRCRNREDGLQNWCRDCNKDYRRINAEKLSDYDRERYRANPEPKKALARQYRADNPEEKKNKDRAYRHETNVDIKRYRADPERFKKKTSDWRKRNPDKVDAQNQRKKLPEFAWHKRYPKRALAHNARTRACKLQRTPPWSEKALIRKFYEGCPSGYHVDHIVPLRGKFVSGLHVLANLQYLPAAENMRKKNHYEDARPD